MYVCRNEAPQSLHMALYAGSQCICMCIYKCYKYMHIIVEHTYMYNHHIPPPQHLPQNLPNTPYVLEELVDNVCEEASSTVKLQLLSAVMKMFMKRPPECQEMLGRLLEHAIGQCLTSVYMEIHVHSTLA